MLWVILFFVGGVLHGVFLRLRKKERKLLKFEASLFPILYLFLFIVGYSVGSNPNVMSKLGWLSLEAVVLAFSGLLGSLLLAPLATRIVRKNKSLDDSLFQNRRAQNRALVQEQGQTPPERDGIRASLLILISFFVGIMLGHMPSILPPCDVRFAQLGVLYALMWVAGISSGGDRSAFHTLRKVHPVILVLPLFIVIGTLAGTAITSRLFLTVSPSQAMGVGAGMGYYSLSCALITSKVGASLGAIALLANLIREVVTIGCAPLIVRFFGPFGLLAAGATTTCTSSLPSVILCAGKRFTFLAVLNGIILSIAVPLLILMIL